MNAEAQVAPNSRIAEQAVIGVLLGRPEMINVVSPSLKAEDFYAEPHRVIYGAMIEMTDAGELGDMISVQDKLERKRELEKTGGGAYITELAVAAPSGTNIEKHVAMIRERATRRKVIKVADDIKDAATNAHNLEQGAGIGIEELFRHLLEGGALREPTRVGKILPGVITSIENRADGVIDAIKKKFSDVDARLSGGLWPGDLVVVAVRPSMGKTSLGVQFGVNTAIDGSRVMAFTLEMSREQLTERLLSQIGGIDSSRIRNGNLLNDDYSRIAYAVNVLHEIPMYIDDQGGLTVQDVAARARAQAKTAGLDMIVLDYLQIMNYSGRANTRSEQISEMSRMMKSLAKELNVPFILLSQLNRDVEKRQDKRPIMADLRESGAIEQDADVIIMLYRDEYYNADSEYKGVAEAIFRKCRNDKTGTVGLAFEGEKVRFADLGGVWNAPAHE